MRLPPHGLNVLIAGPSGSGKSTTATGLLERLEEHRYQFCIIDPEGDYEAFEGAVTVGDPQRGPIGRRGAAVGGEGRERTSSST